MRRYRLRSAYRHITGINISPPLPPFHLIQLRLNALLWRRLVPPSLRVARFALRQSARASSPARASSRRRTASPNPVTPSRRSTPDSPSSRITEALCAEASRDAKRRRARAAADPGAAEEETRPDPPPRGGSRNPRRDASPSRTARGSLALVARARARPLASPRAFQEVVQRGPAAGRFGCPRRAAGGVASRDVRDAARPRRRRPERRSRPGGCRSGTLETKPPPPPPPRPLFRRGSSLRPPRSRSSGTARASRPDRA